MRKYLRGVARRELARAERLIKAWPSPLGYDVYMYRGERNSFGIPIATKLEEGNEYLPSVRSQLKDFWNRIVLGEEPQFVFTVEHKVEPRDTVQVNAWDDSWNGSHLIN